MDVTVLHLMPTLMERQLDPTAGHLLRKEVEARGINVITEASTKAILGDKKVTGIELEDGTVIPADLVVMAVGIRSNSAIAKNAGLTVNRGIVVDDTMQHQRSGYLRAGRMRRGARPGVRPGGPALRDGERGWPPSCPVRRIGAVRSDRSPRPS